MPATHLPGDVVAHCQGQKPADNFPYSPFIKLTAFPSAFIIKPTKI
jgi:hypothetical protein